MQNKHLLFLVFMSPFILLPSPSIAQSSVGMDDIVEFGCLPPNSTDSSKMLLTVIGSGDGKTDSVDLGLLEQIDKLTFKVRVRGQNGNLQLQNAPVKSEIGALDFEEICRPTLTPNFSANFVSDDRSIHFALQCGFQSIACSPIVPY